MSYDYTVSPCMAMRSYGYWYDALYFKVTIIHSARAGHHDTGTPSRLFASPLEILLENSATNLGLMTTPYLESLKRRNSYCEHRGKARCVDADKRDKG